jgi:O-Antigen ligase
MPLSRLAPGALAGVLVFGLAWFDGGFYAPAWGVVSLGLLGVCGCAIVLSERLYLSRLALASIGGLFGLAGWTLMSGLWTSDLTKTISDAELAFVYPIALTAALLVARRTGTSSLAIGTLVAMVAVCTYALGGRLAPDVFGFPNNVDAAGRLYSPIGYWNGLGAFAAMAALLGGGLAAARLPTAVRVGASASLVVTLPTLYLTFSRGALVAAGVGLVVLAVASPARLWLAATLAAALPWAAAAVLVVERRSHLTAVTLDRQAVIDQGHGAIPLLIGCTVGAAATALALNLLAPRVQVGVTVRRIIGAVLIGAIVLACAVAVDRRGGPVELARSVRHSLASLPQGANGNNANRLRDLSLNGRLDQWRVARHMFAAHPLAGEGAGSWEAQWLLHEPYNDYNQRPHSLYLETLAELGIIGAILLAFALVPPLAASARARHHHAASASLAGFVVFLVHAAVDWDWQLPAVTVAALLCAACLLLGAAEQAPGILISDRVRWTLAAATGVLVVCAAVALQGNRLVADAASNVGRGRYAAAAADANRARTWLPWSYQPDSWEGEAELQAGNRSAAAHSFRDAAGFDDRNWRLWLNLARATSGAEQRRAILRVRALYPLSPELAALCATTPKPSGCQ